MKTPSVLFCLFLAASALGDMATQRFGAASVAPGGGGVVVRFDLAALPNDAKVVRARLVPFVKSDGVPQNEPIVIHALDKDGATAIGKPLELAQPRFVTFDATEAVRQWASGKLANSGLIVRGAAPDSRRTCLDVTYEGSPKDPPPPATGLKAIYRAGQVFLTWTEANCPFAGKEVVLWKELKADLDRIRGGNGPVTTYRIYRHTKPITRQTIAQAELLDEVGQHSAFDEREIKTEWKGEQIKNVRVADAPVPRIAVEEKSELPIGTGVWATTCRKDGGFFYAVVATVDGVENTVALNEGNTAGPLREKVAPTEPVFFREQPLQYEKRAQHCYVWWLDPPLANLPSFIHLSVSPPIAEKEAGASPSSPLAPRPSSLRPLFIYNWWWGSGWNRAAQYPMAEAVGFVIDQNCMQTRGVHDGYGTLKAWSQGKVQGWFVRQFRALLPWLKAKYGVDDDRVFALSSGWAWQYPDLFAATFECTTMNMKRSPAGNECKRYWGDPQRPAPTEWGASAWEQWNAPEWIRSNPTVELPLITYAPRMHTGDFGILDKPPLYRALLDTKRAWSACFGEGPLIGHKDPDWMFALRRSDSVAAFGNCSLDDNPGIGFGGDPGGQMNAWLAFEPRTQVDSPDRWEMTLYLVAGDKRGRGGAPLDACTADVTPRRCQRFKPSPGAKVTWTNTSLADANPVQTGTAIADQWGLVTAQRVIISKGKNRLAILPAK
ncbi:MAG: hypothetical protein FJ291_27230 [Planctomycetes bacterium]|nr:hypothetical protein [Planctomycetota bacterium]